MAVNLLDVEISNYWVPLTQIQKQSLLSFILSFYEEEKSNVKTPMNELQEPGAESYLPWEIFKPLNKQ